MLLYALQLHLSLERMLYAIVSQPWSSKQTTLNVLEDVLLWHTWLIWLHFSKSLLAYRVLSFEDRE